MQTTEFCHLTDGIAAYSVMQTRLRHARSTAAPGPVPDHNRKQRVPHRRADIAEPHIFRDRNAFRDRVTGVGLLMNRTATMPRILP